MKIARTVQISIFVAACCFCFAATVYPQGTNLGTIRGMVSDPNGAAIPNAAVQITDQATGISRDVTADSSGNYEALALKPGIYKITASAAGFKTSTREAVVKGSDTVRADLQMEVGAQTQNVTIVGGEAGVIQKDQPVIAGTINNRELIELPRDSRDPRASPPTRADAADARCALPTHRPHESARATHHNAARACARD